MAMRIAENDLADVVMVDIDGDIAKGKALDIEDSLATLGIDKKVLGTSDYKFIEGSDFVVITAGFARKPGMTREDLLQKNADVVRAISLKIKEYANKSIVIVVTNPLDVMTYLAWKVTGFDQKRVFGMAGVLDSARLGSILKTKIDVSLKDVKSYVLGSHGDSMVVIPEFTTIKGKKISEVLSGDKLKELIASTKNRGAEIVSLLKSGSAYFAPSQSVYVMLENIVKGKEDVICASAYLDGQYGQKDIYIGVPVKLGKSGVSEIVKINLNNDELKQFEDSCNIVRNTIKSLNI